VQTAPTQFERQKSLGKTDHLEEISTTEAPAVLDRQLCRQRLHNLLAVLGPFLSKHILADARADMPVEADERRVDRAGGLRASGFDELADITSQAITGHPRPSRYGRRFRRTGIDLSGLGHRQLQKGSGSPDLFIPAFRTFVGFFLG
jgi:hypothetical protein